MFQSELSQIQKLFDLGEEFDYRTVDVPLVTLESMSGVGLLGVRYDLTMAYTELPIFWRLA